MLAHTWLEARYLLAVPLLWWSVCVLQAGDVDPQKLEFFEKKVRPILVANCYNCHSANTKAAGGLRVDDLNGMYHGGGSGPAVVPGSPDESILLQAVRYESFEMPPNKPLDEKDVAILETWIRDGAVGPTFAADWKPENSEAEYVKLRRDHWAWQPLRPSAVPEVADQGWASSEIDRFIWNKLADSGLTPVADASPRDLIRRVTFDLTGLPPTEHEIAEFLNDESPEAYTKVVDRLLASYRFGERWGRHWLDVARYAESTGSSRNVPYPHAYRYRDYVIRAFNEDKPFDQFIREQIAGDLLPASTEAEAESNQVATGFLALGVKDVNQRFEIRFVMDNIDEQIDTVTRSVLGLTVSCARCHDHKFDPIPTKDYYALAGIFKSTDLCAGVRNKMGGGGLDYYDTSKVIQLDPAAELTAEQKKEIESAKTKYEKAKADFEKVRGTPEASKQAANGRTNLQNARRKMNRLKQEHDVLIDPVNRGRIALGVRDAKTISDTELRIRGEAEKLGPMVERGFLSILKINESLSIPDDSSGRRELALWLSSPENALTQRVAVNRVWRHLFGQGIVASVDNFGVTGDAPSHPELLDYLAHEFTQHDWSIKHLVRQIVLSRAYRLGSQTTPEQIEVDPANRLIWRHSPRRLAAEEIRDATLAIAETLEQQPPEDALVHKLDVREIRNNGPEAKMIGDAALESRHRSVYLPLLRGLTPTSLAVFDFAEQGMVTGSRDETTVAPQALYLLNNELVLQQSRQIAVRIMTNEADETGRIQAAFRSILGREPSIDEIKQTAAYLAGFAQSYQHVVSADVPSGQPENTEVSVANVQEQVSDNPDDVRQEDLTVSRDVEIVEDFNKAAWASFCQALLCSSEFLYLR